MAASASQAAPPVQTEKMVYLYPSQIRERKSNNRFIFGVIQELQKSIQSVGIQNPLRVIKTKDKTEDGYPVYEVIVGNRRCRAIKKIAETLVEETAWVPAIIEAAALSETDKILKSISTDIHGLNRNQLEIAYDVNVLIGEGHLQKDIAKMIGKSAQYVSDCMKFLTEANEDLIKQVKSGQLGFTTALDMLKAGEAPEEVVEKVSTALAKKAEKNKGEEVLNPDKNANVVNKVTKSELKEDSGPAKKVSKSAPETSVKAAGSDTPKEAKTDDTTLKLKQLLIAVKANKGTTRPGMTGLLSKIIQFCEGGLNALDMLPIFFWGIDEEMDAAFRDVVSKVPKKIEPFEAGVPEATAAPASAAKEAKADKKKSPAPPAAPAKKGKKVVEEDDLDEDDIEIEEAEDLDDIDEELE